MVRVRLPESIEARIEGEESVRKFYQDIRSEDWPAVLACEPAGLPVSWQEEGAVQRYRLDLDNGCALEVRAEYQAPKAVLDYTFHNGIAGPLHQVQFCTCVQLQGVPALRDPLAERLAVAAGGKVQLLRALVPGFTPYQEGQAVEQRFLAFAEGLPPAYPDNPHVAPHPGHPEDPAQAIHFWQAAVPFSHPVIAGLSKDWMWGVRVYSRGAASVWSNPGISCLHSDPPPQDIAPGQSATFRTTVELFQTTVSRMVR